MAVMQRTVQIENDAVYWSDNPDEPIFLVSGRIPGDDDDMAFLVQAPSADAARGRCAEIMYEVDPRADRADVEREYGTDFYDNGATRVGAPVAVASQVRQMINERTSDEQRLFEVIVTQDTTASAVVGVWADSAEEAADEATHRENLATVAFAWDDENVPDAYYVPDPGAVEEVTMPGATDEPGPSV